MKYLWKIIVVMIAFVLLAGCAPVTPAPLDQSNNPVAKSNGNNYYDPNLYTLTVRIGGTSKDHTETHSYGSSYSSNGYGSGSFVVWQDGKGLIPATVLKMEPKSPIVSVEDSVILKTEDLKMARLEEGWIVDIKCRMDYEPLTNLGVPEEVVDAEKTQTWELDKCRMVTPKFEIDVTVTPEGK